MHGRDIYYSETGTQGLDTLRLRLPVYFGHYVQKVLIIPA